ncbi:unnamed protein product [Linum trigynum]|uniref:Uncharacterized protein n=1 Tax=Linum trigynum TaxID=586398 RepID=A0AAV2GK37_9ROSI
MAKQKKRLRSQSQREESAPRSPVQSNSPSPPLASKNQEEGQGERNTDTPVPITETPRMEQRSPVTELEGETEHVDSTDPHSATDLSSEGGRSNGTTKKRKGRGPGKGVKPVHNLSLEFHDNRIITTQAAREISAIFKRSISGPLITFSEYPASELETVIAHFNNSGFTYTGSEETFNDMVKDHVKRNFPQWMYGLRDWIFKKYKDMNQRINHPPPQISPSTWREMVQKWTNPNWVEMSDKNKGNREKSELVATGGSAPLAKYRHEEDLNSEANGVQGRVGETQGNDVADDESNEETAGETVADA